jgi:YwiC-like protein
VEFPSEPRRDSRLLVPREHGSWALWLLPLLSGGLVGYFSVPSAKLAPGVWFLVVSAASFLIHQPLEVLLGTSLLKVRCLREQRIAVFWVIGFTTLAALGVVELIRWQRSLIFAFGFVVVVCFALSVLFGRRRALRIPRQLVGALGLSATGPSAYYVTTGRIDQTALLLWLGAWLFAAVQIEYVQLRLRTANVKTRIGKARAGWRVGFLQVLLMGATLVAAASGLPALLGLTFVPSSLRLFAWMLRPAGQLKLYVLGFSELFQNIAFNALLTAAFLLRR